MDRAEELAAVARAVVDTNLYMTLGTVDENGAPWLSPVYFVTADCRVFYWASKTDTLHTANLAARPELSIVIFNSQVPVYQGRALFVKGTGEEVPAAELDAGVEIYNGPAATRGVKPLDRADVEAPSPYRLYRATAAELFTLDPNGHDLRVPVDL